MSSLTSKSGQAYYGFDPLSIGGSCRLWLDASDPATIFSDTAGTTLATIGGLVRYWKDKSGMGRHYTQPNAGQEPTYSTSTAITCGTGTSLISTLNNISTYETDLFFVGKPLTSTANNRIIIRGLTRNTLFAVRATSNFPMYIDSAASTRNYTTAITINGSTTILGRVTVVSSAAGPVFDLNGGSSTSTGGVAFAQGDPNQFYRLANGWGDINEVLVFQNLTTQLRSQIEGYLARKWGLLGSLPATHPYKTLPLVSRGFIPTDIGGCTLWLDGADRSTMQLSGSNVTGWIDKSGNNNHAYQGISGRYPTVSTGGVVFNGTSQYLGIRNPSVTSTTGATILVVVQATSSTQAGDIIRKGRGLTGNEFYIRYTTGTTASHISGQFTVGGTAAASSLLNGGTTSRILLMSRYDNTNNRVTLRVNGTDRTSTTTTGTLAQTVRDIRIGAEFGVNDTDGGTPTAYWAGTISEIVIFNRLLTTSEQFMIEGYLARKWNTYSSLPTTHPGNGYEYNYSNSLFTPRLITGLQIWTDASTLTQADGTALTTWPNGGSGGTINCSGTVQQNQLNGLPVVRFTPSQSWTPASTVSLSAYTLCFVNRHTGGTSKRILTHVTNNQLYGHWMGYKGTYFVDTSNTDAGLYTAPADTEWDIFTHTRTAGGAYLFRWNGVEIYRGTTSSANGMTGLQINPSGGAENSDCEVAEIILYNSVLTVQQLQILEGYLANKWNLRTKLPAYISPTLVTPLILPIPLSSIRIGCDASTLTQANNTALTTWTNYGTSGPTINCTGVVKTDSLNGYRVVEFGTTNTWTTSPVINYSSYTMIFVSRLTGTTNRRVFQTNSPNQLFGYFAGFKRSLYTNQSAYTNHLTTVPADTCWDIYSHTRVAGGAYKFRWNGNLLFYGNQSPVDNLTGLCINTGGNSAETSTCQIAEVIVCDSILTDSQIRSTEEYLSAKWGIPISTYHTYADLRA